MSRDERASLTESRDVVLAACFGAVVLGPAAAFLLALAPDWCLAYRVDYRRIPSFFPALDALATAAAPALGVLLARTLSWTKRPRLVWQLLFLIAGLSAATLVIGAGRLGHVATHTQFHDDFGVRPVAGSPLGYALLWLAGVVAAGIAITARGIRRHQLSLTRD
ncbi:MAG: hypothetical protein R3B13_24490 [Polyangiaceae bacterium]